MEDTNRFERLERRDFDIAKWDVRLSKAQSARTMWDSDIIDCQKIRDNDLPTRGRMSSLEGFTSKFYIDNWIQKSNYWKASLLMGYDVFFDLMNQDGIYDDVNRDLLESEVNFAVDRFEIMKKTGAVIDDWLYFGLGSSYCQWNKRAIDSVWRTGKPEFRYFDPRNIWVDEGAEMPDWSDIRWIFALSLLDVEDAKLRFPKYADKISESVSDYRLNRHSSDAEKLDVYLIQYKKKFIVERVDLFNVTDGSSHSFYKEELEEFLMSGQELPDNIEIGDIYECEEDIWFQFFYCKGLSLVLSEPVMIGSEHSFQFLLGYKVDKDVYPRSITWYMKDLQEISVILMTLLTIQAIKINKATPYVEEGSLVDMDDFEANRDKLDYVGTISAEWRKLNPNAGDPIKWDRPEFRPDIPVTLQNMIINSIKTTTGSIDSARGEGYSGQSGVQTAQLQAAASIFTKQDEIKWHNYLRQIGEKLKSDIARYKVHEHEMMGVNEVGEIDRMLVNEGNIPQFNAELYYCVPFVETTPEIMKQMEKDRAIQLNQAGKMSTVDMLNELQIPNPEQVWQRALDEQGLMQVVQILQENPDLMQSILSGASDMSNENNKKKS
jgi:hypothetical protein